MLTGDSELYQDEAGLNPVDPDKSGNRGVFGCCMVNSLAAQRHDAILNICLEGL